MKNKQSIVSMKAKRSIPDFQGTLETQKKTEQLYYRKKGAVLPDNQLLVDNHANWSMFIFNILVLLWICGITAYLIEFAPHRYCEYKENVEVWNGNSVGFKDFPLESEIICKSGNVKIKEYEILNLKTIICSDELFDKCAHVECLIKTKEKICEVR